MNCIPNLERFGSQALLLIQMPLPEIVARLLDYNAGEQDDGDDVGECHESIAGVAQIPHEVDGGDGTDKRTCYPQEAIDITGATTKHIF